MATKKKARVAPAGVSPIDLTSNVKETDIVLVNRNQTDYQTNVEELAKGVGSVLNVDGLAVEIDKNTESINEIGLELGINVGGGGNGQPPVGGSVTDRIEKLENHNFEGGPSASGDTPTKGTHQKRLDALEAEVGIGGGGGGGTSISDQLQAIDAEQVLQDGWIGRSAGDPAPAKSHETRIGELEGRVDDVESDVADNASAIEVNSNDIETNAKEIAKLKGALVYKGVADFNQAPPSANAGEFYAASGDTSSPDSGWGASGTVTQGDYYAFDGNGWAKVGNTESVHDVVDDFHVTAKSGNALTLTYQNATDMDAALVDAIAALDTKLDKGIHTLAALPA